MVSDCSSCESPPYCLIVIHASPNQVYENRANNQEIMDRNTQTAKDKLAKYEQTQFQLNQKNFISSNAYYSHVRSKIKAQRAKEIIIKYVPLILEISKIIKPSDTVVERPRYELREHYYPYRTVCNERLVNGRREYIASRIYASDLIECTIQQNRLSISMVQAMHMNGIKRTNLNDLVLHDLMG